MEVIKILLITVLAAFFVGAIIGAVFGKRAVKKITSPTKALLSKRELIAYISIFSAGVICIGIGFYLSQMPNVDAELDQAMINQNLENPAIGEQDFAKENSAGQATEEPNVGEEVEVEVEAEAEAEALPQAEPANENKVTVKCKANNSGSVGIIGGADGHTMIVVA